MYGGWLLPPGERSLEDPKPARAALTLGAHVEQTSAVSNGAALLGQLRDEARREVPLLPIGPPGTGLRPARKAGDALSASHAQRETICCDGVSRLR